MYSQIRKLIVLGLVALPFIFWAMAGQATSFDCAKASTAVEKMICADAELSSLDEKMATVYEKALQQNEKHAAAIQQEQKQWMKKRNACADMDWDCVKEAYLTRLDSLVAMWGGAWMYSGGTNNVLASSEPLCQVLLKRLNRYEWKEEYSCSLWGILATYPEFSDPPWEDIDPETFGLEKYEDLVFKLYKYNQENPSRYFHRMPGLQPQQPDLVYHNRAKSFIQDGGRLQVWRTKISAFTETSTTRPDPSRTRERTLIRMIYGYPWKRTMTQRERDDLHNNTCKGIPEEPDRGTIFYVTADLSGPDPDVDTGTFSITGGHDLKMYQGSPIFVGYAYASLWRDAPYGLSGFCNFEFIKGGR